MTGLPQTADKLLEQLRTQLMQMKTWRYLRYLHLRETFARVADEVETVVVCGTGHGYAELALAVEFAHVRFTFTDIVAPGPSAEHPDYPIYHGAMKLAWAHGVDNVAFSIWDVLQPTQRRFDMVCSTEMLEHIEQDKRAAANMRAAATKYVYCLVPFADKAANANAGKRQRMLERMGHHVLGYDAEEMTRLFPDPVEIAGTYWRDAGAVLRARLQAMEAAEIPAAFDELASLAREDLIDRTPLLSDEAQGIKILSRA